MRTITVYTNKPYNVYIGDHIIQSIGSLLANKHTPCKSVIISDSNVWPLYGPVIENNMILHCFEPLHFIIPPGESSKNTNTYFQILNFLAQNEICRSDIIIALGGGVTGDLAGFVAATYMRGISYIQVPTSLLAMVDSSVGGKTAIDLPEGKNLVGAFYQPSFVICDISFLQTLPHSYFMDGCAEIIKTAILFDEALFAHLYKHTFCFDREYVISKCIQLKANIVASDEFDMGKRQLLNFGHTFGHSIEKLSEFRISHGKAVAIGMYQATAISTSLEFCSAKTNERIMNILRNFDFNITCDYSVDEIIKAILMDKKRSGQNLALILPKEIGNCTIEPISINRLHQLLSAGGSAWTSP